MEYYHIRLCTDARDFCTTILSWDKYKYKRLPMGVCNSLDIFKEKGTNYSNVLNTYVFISMIYESLQLAIEPIIELNLEKSTYTITRARI